MKIKEKIKKVYQKNNIIVNEETIEAIMKDKERTKGLIKIYEDEEISSMNYIFGKPEDNKYFTQFELESARKIDLFNKKVIDICKIIWENKDDSERLKSFIKILEESRCSKCI